MRTLHTDVLIIGGGCAGLRAAIAAAGGGADALLVYRAGGNNSSVGAGNLAACAPFTPGDSPSVHYEDTMRSGCALADPSLAAIFTERAGKALEEARSWGVRFYTRPDGALRFFRSGGHSAARAWRCLGGHTGQFIRVLTEKARSLGVRFAGNCSLVELLLDKGRVCGACGVDGAGDPVSIQARAVVLATGGYAGAYARTTNKKALLGAGCAMAWEAGAALTDLEFVQFMPTTLAFPQEVAGRVVNDPLRGEGAVLLNAALERFMPRYDPELADLSTRDVVAAAIVSEVAQGRGTCNGAVYLDARAVPPARIESSYSGVTRLRALGLDPCEHLLEVSPAAHFTCGGVVVDAACAAAAEGLYAAGEVMAGVHGANRLGGNALTETLVFGAIAGENAARHAMRMPRHSASPSEDFLARLAAGPGARPMPDFAVRLEQLRALFWDQLGVIRNAPALEEAARRFDGLRDDLLRPDPSCGFSGNIQRRQLAQTALIGMLAARAASRREESRGTHRRSDYCAEDERLRGHMVFRGAAHPDFALA
jgi:aspartate oxidase